MAGDWIKMRHDLEDDPAVVQMASLLGIDEFGIVGRLHAVWSWVDRHSVDGTNVRIMSALLDRKAARQGFADAMRTVGWLGGRDGCLSFPNYDRHNGETAKRRASESKRKSDVRKMSGEMRTNVRKMSGKCPEKCGLEESRVELLTTTKTKMEGQVGTDFALAAMSPEAQIEHLQREHPDIDVGAEVKRFKQFCSEKGGYPTYKGLLGWLKKASPRLNLKRGDLPSKVIPIENGQAPIPEHEQKQMAQKLAEMRKAQGV
jgi:hypothetical protein